jgi:hypothetical protein
MRLRLGSSPIGRALRLAALLATHWIAGCGSGKSKSGVDPTPEKKDGTPSYEFEQEDLDAAGVLAML